MRYRTFRATFEGSSQHNHATKGKLASNNPYTDLCLEEVPPDR
jgi:hypothetical protein